MSPPISKLSSDRTWGNPDVEEKVIDLILASVAGQLALVQQAFGGGVDGTGRGQGVFADEGGRGKHCPSLLHYFGVG